MSGERIVAFATLRLCIDTCRLDQIGGAAYSPLLPEPIVFDDLGEMVTRLDEMMDQGRFPQAFMRLRTFQKKLPREPAMPFEAPAEAPEKKGNIATFEITIRSRLSADWQGMVGRPGEEKINFSGVLELLRYIDEQVRCDIVAVPETKA